MTDAELQRFLCLSDEEAANVIPKLSPERRATYRRMSEVAIEAELWLQGLGPKPEGVLIDTARGTRHRRAWK